MLPRVLSTSGRLFVVLMVCHSTVATGQVGGQFGNPVSSPYSPAPALTPVPNPSFNVPSPNSFGVTAPSFSTIPAPGSFTGQTGAVLGGAVRSFDPYAIPRGMVSGGPSTLAPGVGFSGPSFGPSIPQQFTAPPSNIWSGQIPAFGNSISGNLPRNSIPGGITGVPGQFSPGTLPRNAGQFIPPSSLPPNTIAPNQLPPGANIVRPPGMSAPYGQPTGPPFRSAPGVSGTLDPYARGGFGGGGLGSGQSYQGSGFGQSGFGQSSFGQPGFNQQGGAFGGNSGFGSGGYNYGNDLGYGDGAQPPFQRLFQDTGLRGTYLHGTDNNDLAITEFEASTTAYFANFLGIPNGLRVTPGFTFHWLDGPKFSRAHAPSRLYSAYLDFGLEPQFTPRFGADVAVRVGAYSDFQAFNMDSIRILGSGVGIYQVTPQVALKMGAAYIDRVRIKLLPAAGILWTPNPQTRWDIFFPAAKLANQWRTVNNREVWWYVGAEYGGGSWSIEREENPQRLADDRMDINDIRVYLGVDMWNLNRFYGFGEIGYVFDRELVFNLEPGETTSVGDTFMARLGLSW